MVPDVSHPIKYPTLQEFDLTQEDIEKEIKNRELKKDGSMILPAYIGISFILSPILLSLAEPSAMFFLWLGGLAFAFIAHTQKKDTIDAIVLNNNYDKYKEACVKWELLQSSYWTNTTGIIFEHRVADLLHRLGYEVQVTKASNDGGIDIIASKNNINIAVQCKCHKRPIGPKDARELYGVICDQHHIFKEGMLVCPAGFTKGVYNFVSDKPIKLLELTDLITLVKKTA